jgi:hypothetical protein
MTRRYHSTRTKPHALTLPQLYQKLQSLYLMFRERDYFKQRTGISAYVRIPDQIQHEAALALDFQPFPIAEWDETDITEDHIFDVIEFLYDHASEPGEWVEKQTDTGFNYCDYVTYDAKAGRAAFREKANAFLADYKAGYVLSESGQIIAQGTAGLQYILDADIVPYDARNVDSKVQHAVSKWRDRHSTASDKKEAVRELADVFEWLKKTKRLAQVLDRKDESAIFEIANSFAIRHHDPKQKANYDQGIWYSWMFHFYLATYHAVIRLLAKGK